MKVIFRLSFSVWVCSHYCPYFKVIHGFLRQSADVIKGRQTALVLSGRDNAVQLQLRQRRHDILGLGTVSALVCSQPDTQFHSNKHEIDSKDQIQTACNWKCTTVGQSVWMRSSVCVCDDFMFRKGYVCARETKRVRKSSWTLYAFSQESAISYVLSGWWLKQWEVWWDLEGHCRLIHCHQMLP